SFFRILPRPLSSTLFPYTTLFRSLELLGATDLAAIGDGIVLDAAHFNLRALFDGDVSAPPDDVHNAKYLCHGLRSLPLDLEFQRDRKSTRLNSSHVKISYAVFCLK